MLKSSYCLTVDSGQLTVESEQLTVDNGEWKVESGQWTEAIRETLNIKH